MPMNAYLQEAAGLRAWAQPDQETKKQYAEKSPAAYTLRDTIVRHMPFAYRNEPDVLGRVQSIVFDVNPSASRRARCRHVGVGAGADLYCRDIRFSGRADRGTKTLTKERGARTE